MPPRKVVPYKEYVGSFNLDTDLESLAKAREDSRFHTINAKIKVVTPIFGGGVEAAKSDPEDVIRASTIRGHVRFWWRALYASNYDSIEEMYNDEAKIWGGTQ